MYGSIRPGALYEISQSPGLTRVAYLQCNAIGATGILIPKTGITCGTSVKSEAGTQSVVGRARGAFGTLSPVDVTHTRS